MENGLTKILIVSSDKELTKVLNICFLGWGYKVVVWSSFASDLNPVKKISPSVIVVDIHSANKMNLEICRMLKDDFMTAYIPVITLIDKRQLKTELLSLKQGVDDYLIKPPDPFDLRIRIEMAIRRSQYSFCATPLTGLPGGRVIEEIVEEKIKNNLPFSFGYVDIDNFKSFNDSYGYIKGDRVIMQTAYMLYNAVKKFGSPGDFIGHIGGDDFVFISTPGKYKEISSNFITLFDRIIPFHYTDEDRKKGFIVAEDRNHKVRKLPLMNVSVAVVNKDEHSKLRNVIQVNERAAEIKHYLKEVEGSKFMAERRNTGRGDDFNPRVHKKDTVSRFYKPLGQILITNKVLSCEQLDEALTTHWKRGVIFGEILKELGFLNEAELKRVLDVQKASLI